MYINIVQFDIVIKRTPFQGFFDKDSWPSIRLRLRAVCQNAFENVSIYDNISDYSLNVFYFDIYLRYFDVLFSVHIFLLVTDGFLISGIFPREIPGNFVPDTTTL